MSHRTIVTLAAAALCVACVATDALARVNVGVGSRARVGPVAAHPWVHAGGAWRGRAWHGGPYYGWARPGAAVGLGAAAVGAAAIGAAAYPYNNLYNWSDGGNYYDADYFSRIGPARECGWGTNLPCF